MRGGRRVGRHCRAVRSLCAVGGQIPGVPIMYIKERKFTIERMPEAFGGALPGRVSVPVAR